MKAVNQVIDGPEGALEIRVREQEKDSGKGGNLVILSHPHPLYGGTMNNKVVTTMEKAFSIGDFTTIAYNFRGVGSSAGQYNNGVGEQDDLRSVIAWARQTYAPNKLVLAGFSFGSYVSLKVTAAQVNIDALYTVAPPVGLYDFSEINQIEMPWVLIQGGQDEVISADEVQNWAMRQTCRPDVFWRSKASHFFHGELIWLRKMIVASL